MVCPIGFLDGKLRTWWGIELCF